MIARPNSWNRYVYTEGDPWVGFYFWGGGGFTPQRPLPLDPPTRPECNRKNALNAKKLDWIDAHGDDAATAAAKIGTTEAVILGLSALESGWALAHS